MTYSSLAQKFHEEGYVILPAVLSEKDISQIFSQIDFLLSRALELKGDKDFQLGDASEKYLRLKERYPNQKSRAYDLMKHLDAVRYVANKVELTAVIRELTETPVLVDHTLVRIDDFSNDRVRPLHQEGLGQISLFSLTAWIPLVDVDLDTGTIKFVPGTHKQDYVEHRFYEEMGGYHGVVEKFLEAVKPEAGIMKAGDALIFHPCLFHGSYPMRVDKGLRWTLISRYNSLKDIPYLESESAPKHTEQIDQSKRL